MARQQAVCRLAGLCRASTQRSWLGGLHKLISTDACALLHGEHWKGICRRSAHWKGGSFPVRQVLLSSCVAENLNLHRVGLFAQQEAHAPAFEG